ncbi:hypothetical protein Ancab_001591 [Ancistrocladus abbreviatus]
MASVISNSHHFQFPCHSHVSISSKKFPCPCHRHPLLFHLSRSRCMINTVRNNNGAISSVDRISPITTKASSTNQISGEADSVSVSLPPNQYSATDVVRNFYEGINRHDLAAVEPFIADNCVYEDLIFPRPFVGRKAILEFFKKFTDSISTDLQFTIDDISGEDTMAVGVTWHLEWKGKPFPFSKGCSFYRMEVLNGKQQIVYGRDSVEPAIKPGESALAAIRGVTWLLQRFPQLVDRL